MKFNSTNSLRIQTLTIRRYLYYSTILGVFSGILIFRAGFDIRFFYFIIFTNTILIFLIATPKRIPRWIGYMVLYLLLSGTVGVFRGTDTVSQFLKEFLGITCNAVFYYFFFHLFQNDYLRAFTTYARLSYWACILGFPILIYESLKAGAYIRLHSISSEPAMFCMLNLPAYFWYASKYMSQRKHTREVIVFSLAMVLSGSSLGYVSVAFGIFLLPFRHRAWLIGTPVIAGALLLLAYSVSSNVKVRVDDTALALAHAEVTGTNPSTFAWVSNLMVTEKVFQKSPWIGNGLGSHAVSFQRLIGDVPGLGSIPEQWVQFNAQDAASLTFRLLSEQGLLGLLLVLWFIVKFHAGWKGEHAQISNALLVSFFLQLLRVGIYFDPEQFFFVFIYLLNYRSFKREAGALACHRPSRSSTEAISMLGPMPSKT